MLPFYLDVDNMQFVCIKYSLVLIHEICAFVCISINTYTGDRGGALVKVLCYKSEGRWFDSG